MPGEFGNMDGFNPDQNSKMDLSELLGESKEISLEGLKEGEKKFNELQDKHVKQHERSENDKADLPDLNEIKGRIEEISEKDAKRRDLPPIDNDTSEK